MKQADGDSLDGHAAAQRPLVVFVVFKRCVGQRMAKYLHHPTKRGEIWVSKKQGTVSQKPRPARRM